MSYLKRYNAIKFKRFRKLEFVLGLIVLPCFVSCGAIFDLLAGKRDIPIVSYSECWRSTTPLNGKRYVQRVVISRVETNNPNYLFKDVLARIEIDQAGNSINNSKELDESKFLFLYSDPRDGSSALSQAFVEVPYQLESQTNELLEKGVIKFNINEMTVQDDLNGQTYHMKPCTNF